MDNIVLQFLYDAKYKILAAIEILEKKNKLPAGDLYIDIKNTPKIIDRLISYLEQSEET